MDKEKKSPFTITFKREKMFDEKGKPIKSPKGEQSYKREDFNGLMGLFGKYDSRLHDMKSMKMIIKVKDKIYQAWVDEKTDVEFSLDEASFLKSYLSEFSEKEGKTNAIQEFEMRTLTGLLEEME